VCSGPTSACAAGEGAKSRKTEKMEANGCLSFQNRTVIDTIICMSKGKTTTTGTHAASLEALAKVLGALDGLQPTDQEWVVGTALSRLGLQVPGPVRSGPGRGDDSGRQQVAALPGQHTGDADAPREFMRNKKPQTEVQKVACLAYFLAKQRQQTQFKTRDLSNLNIEAAGHKIGNPSMAVDNATKQNHYFAPAGGGKKQLTPLGDAIVEALPDQDAVKKVEAEEKPRKRARRGKKQGSES